MSPRIGRTPDRGLAAAEPVARLLTPVLGWDAGQVSREVDAYRASVDAERTAETEPDDQAADLVRRRARDLRGLLASPVR